jgi:hypothetical protein
MFERVSSEFVARCAACVLCVGQHPPLLMFGMWRCAPWAHKHDTLVCPAQLAHHLTLLDRYFSLRVRPSVMEAFANMTLEGTTDNIIDRLLLERAARENEVKMSTLPRRRGPVAKPPVQDLLFAPLVGTDSGEAGADEREDGEGDGEPEAANADIADLFASIQAASRAPPAEPHEVFVPVFDHDVTSFGGGGDTTAEFVVPVFREVGEGVGSRVASLTSPREGSRGERATLLAARVSNSGLMERKVSPAHFHSSHTLNQLAADQLTHTRTGMGT